MQFENTVYNQLKFYGKLQYYSLKTGKEIEFILNEKYAIEVKETATVQDMLQLKNLSQNINLKLNVMVSHHPSHNFTDFVWGGDLG